MSLTSFLDLHDVTAKVKPLRPKFTRKIGVPLKVKPRTNNYMLVGTAFDYLLRFELHRRAPHAVAAAWVAEYVPDKIWREDENGVIGIDIFSGASPDDYMPPEEVAQRARIVVEEARAAEAAYRESEVPDRTRQAELAAHAIRLAKLDSVYRARTLDPRFEEVDPQDIRDSLDMLAIVPFDELLHPKVLLLNPSFDDSSRLVHGADADLITGDLLVDFKTTIKGEMQTRDLDQVLGYYLLARNQRRLDANFPMINRLGIYYCRQGHLWTLNTDAWTDNPQFPVIEEWFFKRAEAVFGSR